MGLESAGQPQARVIGSHRRVVREYRLMAVGPWKCLELAGQRLVPVVQGWG